VTKKQPIDGEEQFSFYLMRWSDADPGGAILKAAKDFRRASLERNELEKDSEGDNQESAA
jgi:hypothetical protein